MNKKYDVYFYYEVRGKTTIEASSEKEADAKFTEILENEGIDDEADYDIQDRDYGVTIVQENTNE
jgi:hypothetical protein